MGVTPSKDSDLSLCPVRNPALHIGSDVVQVVPFPRSSCGQLCGELPLRRVVLPPNSSKKHRTPLCSEGYLLKKE
jgi:hypothetical protein